MKLKRNVEILAPAGSMESMIAAINAGADAVYMGEAGLEPVLMQITQRRIVS